MTFYNITSSSLLCPYLLSGLPGCYRVFRFSFPPYKPSATKPKVRAASAVWGTATGGLLWSIHQMYKIRIKLLFHSFTIHSSSSVCVCVRACFSGAVCSTICALQRCPPLKCHWSQSLPPDYPSVLLLCLKLPRSTFGYLNPLFNSVLVVVK